MHALPAAPYPMLSAAASNSVVQKYKEKILLGIPTFGIDYTKTGNRYQKRVMHAADGILLTQKNHTGSQFNEETRTPFVQYSVGNTRNTERHIVHYEDARSISEKFDLLDRAGLGGINIMSLEYDAPVLWQILNQRYTIQKY